MAEEQDITLNIKIDAAASASTVKELRTSLKDLKNQLDQVPAGSAGFTKLTKSINDTEGKLGDLNDSFNTLTGSGVERTTKSFGLLKEGFSTFDAGKIKAGFSGIGAAMKAIPIFLIVEGIRYLVENFEELSKGSGLVATVLKAIGKIVEELKLAFNSLTDAIGATNTELDRLSDAIDKGLVNTNAYLSEFNHNLDNQIKLAKIAGESTVEFEKQKQLAIIASNKYIVEQLILLVRSGKELSEEQTKQLKASMQAIQDAGVERKVIVEKAHQDALAVQQKHAADRKALQDKEDAEIAQRAQARAEFIDEQITLGLQAELKAAQAKVDYNKAVDEELDRIRTEKYRKDQEALAAGEQQDIDSNAKRIEGYKKTEQSKLEITKQALAAGQAITDLVFAHQLKQAKGNAAKETEIRKKQFNVNKAFGIANSIIDGVGAIQKALNNPYPLNIILAVLTGVLATANTIKIATSKFEPDSGGGASADTGALSAPAPVVPSPNNSTTKIKDDGTVGTDKERIAQPTVKAIVVETDVTSSQKRINTIEESAKFG